MIYIPRRFRLLPRIFYIEVSDLWHRIIRPAVSRAMRRR